MSVNAQPAVIPGQTRSMPQNLNPLQQQQYQQYQQQQQQQIQQAELDQKKLQDMIDALALVSALRQDMNTILDNVARANSANNYSAILGGVTGRSEQLAAGTDVEKKLGVGSSLAATPSSSSYQSQVDQDLGNVPKEETAGQEDGSLLTHLDQDKQQFFETTDSKYLQEKALGLGKSMIELERILSKLQPVVVKEAPEFVAVLGDQAEQAGLGGSRLMNNYRWVTKVQELINSTALPVYKRYGQPYNASKVSKYKSYSIKAIKKEELDKYVSQHLTHNEIKVITAQRTDNEFVLDIIMPQHFKFVFLLFDCNVEKLQVRPLDMRLLKIYSANKPSDEICTFDFDYTHVSHVFQKLEESCLLATAHFRTEYGLNHFRYILQWIKNYTNLFNAKCISCGSHLLNGLPPTWRDLKTYEAYHDECRL